MRNKQLVVEYRVLSIYGGLLLLSVAALLVGFQLEHTFHWPFAAHLVNEMGIAGIVGLFLAFTFERLSTDEFRKVAQEERDEIKRDIFHYVYGHNVPLAIRDIIDNQILHTHFVRRNLVADFTLKLIEVPGSPVKYVSVTRELSFELENLTDEPQPYGHVSSTDKAPIASLNHEVKYTGVAVEGVTQPFSLKEEDLQPRLRENDYEKWLDLDSLTVPAKGRARVSIASQTVKHFEGGFLYLILTHHTCEMNLRVFVDSKLPVGVLANAFADNVLKATPSHKPDQGFFEWKLEKPLLAYQGIYIAWGPKKVEGAHAPSRLAAAGHSVPTDISIIMNHSEMGM
jgi:hypothetical protein